MGRRLADEQEMPARRLHRLADRLARVKIVAEIDRIEPGVTRAMGGEPAPRRHAFAVLLVVPILRHDEFGLQRHHLIMPWRHQRRSYHAMEIFDLAAAALARDSSSPRSSGPSADRNISTRRFIAPAARWKTGSRNASSISMPIAPQPTRCRQISCAFGSPRWPTCYSAHCGGSGSPTRLPTPVAAPFVSSYSRSAPWFAPAAAASKSRWRQAVCSLRLG